MKRYILYFISVLKVFKTQWYSISVLISLKTYKLLKNRHRTVVKSFIKFLIFIRDKEKDCNRRRNVTLVICYRTDKFKINIYKRGITSIICQWPWPWHMLSRSWSWPPTDFRWQSLFVIKKVINEKSLKNDVSFLQYETEIFYFKVYFTTFHAKRLPSHFPPCLKLGKVKK